MEIINPIENKEANHIRAEMCKGAIDNLIKELEKYPDSAIVNSKTRKVKIKVTII